MAQALPGFAFIGSLGHLSAYKMRGSDKIILRSKGGASKQKIKTSPSFDLTRKINAEFGGRSVAAKWLIRMLWPQKALADYNIIGPLNALIKPIQALDTESEFGRRHVLFTRHPGLLGGFSLNKQIPFDSIIKNPVVFSIDKDSISARVTIPGLMPGINFYVPGKYPMYSFVVALGIVPDLMYTTSGYKPASGFETIYPFVKETEWYPVMNGSAAAAIELNFPSAPPDASFSLLLSIGIRFGTMSSASTVQQIKHAGAARILAMV